MKKFLAALSLAVLCTLCHAGITIPRITNVPDVHDLSGAWATAVADEALCSYMSCYDAKMLYLAVDVRQKGKLWAGSGRGLAFFNDRLEVTVERGKKNGVLRLYADAAGKLYVQEKGATVSAGNIELRSSRKPDEGYRLLLSIPWARLNPDNPVPHAVSLNLEKVRVTKEFSGFERHKLKETFIPGTDEISIPASIRKPVEHERVINFGRPGHNSALICDMLPAVLDCKPDVVMLMVGTNDVVWRQRWLTTAEYTVFLNTCCNLLKEYGCRVILITIPPCVEEHVARREKCTPEETRQLMPRIDAINRAIVKVAKEYNYPVADFNALFTTDIRSRESLLRNVANGGGRDGVHPTVEGYRRLAVMLKQIMDLHKMPDTRIACVGDSITYGVHVEGAGTNTGATYPAQLLKLLNEQDKQQ